MALADYAPEVQHNINRLLTIIRDDATSEVLLHDSQQVQHIRTDGGTTTDDIVFPDRATYHSVIDEFLLPHGQKKLGEDELLMVDTYAPELNGNGIARINVVGPRFTQRREAIATIRKAQLVS